jgi:hypothetical protein
MKRPRYVAQKSRGGTWSVIDSANEQIAEMRNVLLVGLSQELANDMARLLILENRTETPGD